MTQPGRWPSSILRWKELDIVKSQTAQRSLSRVIDRHSRRPRPSAPSSLNRIKERRGGIKRKDWKRRWLHISYIGTNRVQDKSPLSKKNLMWVKTSVHRIQAAPPVDQPTYSAKWFILTYSITTYTDERERRKRRERDIYLYARRHYTHIHIHPYTSNTHMTTSAYAHIHTQIHIYKHIFLRSNPCVGSWYRYISLGRA